MRAWRREEGRFSADYNSRLFNGLVVISLAVIVVFRFAIRQRALESAGWAAFIFLQARRAPAPWQRGGCSCLPAT